MKPKVVLAIDSGTTGNRVMAFSKEGKVVAKSYYEFRQIFPQAGWVEHDPLEILETTLKALKEVVRKVGAQNIVSIGMTNQRETAILWDKTTGKPLHNAIVWQDRRTEGMCRELSSSRAMLKEKTGLFLDPYFSATKIRWLIQNVSGLREKIAQGQVLFGTPETWVLWNLSGRKSHATEPSNASRTLLYNIRDLRFDPEILKAFEIPDSILPEVRSSDALFGYTDKKILGREIPIQGILGDQQAALFAHGGWEKGLVKATYGTGIFILTNTLTQLCSSEKLITTVAWKIKDEISYAIEGSIFMGGATLQWLRDNLKILKQAPYSEQAAQTLKDNEDVYFVPAFQGLGAPYWDPRARGLLIGLTRKTSISNIVRAALEALAYQVRDVTDEIKFHLGEKFHLLKVDGGACANNFLMQFQSDILGLSVERPKMIETTALGAAGISGISSGFWSRNEFKNLSGMDRRFNPTLEPKTAERYYVRWKDAVKRSREWSQL